MAAQIVERLERPGWLTFSAVVLFAFAVMRIISALYYFADSRRINQLSRGAFGNHMFAWGVWDVVIALLAFWAAGSLLDNKAFGRLAGYLWAALVIVQSFALIEEAPWFGAASILLAVLVIYGVSRTSDWSDEPTRVKMPAPST